MDDDQKTIATLGAIAFAALALWRGCVFYNTNFAQKPVHEEKQDEVHTTIDGKLCYFEVDGKPIDQLAPPYTFYNLEDGRKCAYLNEGK